jgi:hypothetical protein
MHQAQRVGPGQPRADLAEQVDHPPRRQRDGLPHQLGSAAPIITNRIFQPACSVVRICSTTPATSGSYITRARVITWTRAMVSTTSPRWSRRWG